MVFRCFIFWLGNCKLFLSAWLPLGMLQLLTAQHHLVSHLFLAVQYQLFHNSIAICSVSCFLPWLFQVCQPLFCIWGSFPCLHILPFAFLIFTTFASKHAGFSQVCCNNKIIAFWIFIQELVINKPLSN